MGASELPSQPPQLVGENRAVRGRYRFREYTIGPDRRAEAEPVTARMECATCGVSGPTSRAFADGTEWATRHLKANPEHVDYRERVIRPYRFEPGAWQ